MTYDDGITLITKTYAKDSKISQQIPTGEQRVDILCGVKSIGRNEFYNAAVAGFKPTVIFIVHNYEYEGQKTVEYKGQKYNVIKTYATGFEELELTCERNVTNG